MHAPTCTFRMRLGWEKWPRWDSTSHQVAPQPGYYGQPRRQRRLSSTSFRISSPSRAPSDTM